MKATIPQEVCEDFVNTDSDDLLFALCALYYAYMAQVEYQNNREDDFGQKRIMEFHEWLRTATFEGKRRFQLER